MMNILDIVFPRICVGCGREGEYICVACQVNVIKPASICPMCCRPSLDGWTHPKCRSELGMERLIVGLSYPGLVQQCLKKVKYKSAWEIMSFLYGLWEARLSSTTIAEFHQDYVITSVPMWRQKEMARGFNQAETLAQLIAKKNKVPNLVFLRRARETRPMYGLTRKERGENIHGVFVISDKVPRGAITRVILVDDVWTTGATMRECTRVLKQAGVHEVWGIALAK